MLGYTQPSPSNDIYIFLEEDEISRLENERLQGIYFNFRNPKVIGVLEVSVNDEIDDFTKTLIERDANGFVTLLQLEMKQRVHLHLKERRTHELHEGFRKIIFRTAGHLSTLSDKTNYFHMKSWQDQLFEK